jgi:hypothetical protein
MELSNHGRNVIVVKTWKSVAKMNVVFQLIIDKIHVNLSQELFAGLLFEKPIQ